MPFRIPPARTRRATHRLVIRLSLACAVGAAAAVPLFARTGQVSARGRTAHSVAIPRPPAVTPTARVTASPTPAPPPVVTPYPSPAPGRTWAGPTYLVGAYYFSGWSHGQSDNLTSLLTTGPMRRYEPITGWYDDSQAQVDKAIDQAAGAGIGFFAFDWYNLLRSHYATDKSLNDALRFYLASKHRYRLKFCLNFVDQAPFLPHAGDWPLLVNTWIKYFKQPDYVRVDGKPLFIIFSPEHMRDIFGGSKNVHKALDYLRWAVRKAGLPGVTIAIGTTVTPTANPYHLAMLRTEGYDVTTGYNYHAIGHEQYRTPAPYSDLMRENEQMWDRVIATYTQPYIPVITMNWDQRFSAREQKTAIIYDGRTPEQFTCYASAARRWIDEHPARTPRERIVLVFAWNEIGEGSALIPNKVDGYTYLNVIRRVFGAPGQPPGPEPC